MGENYDWIKKALCDCHMEIEFEYKKKNYFISDSVDKSKGILICGPDNDEFVQTFDDVLDKLLVDGKPLREMIEIIDI